MKLGSQPKKVPPRTAPQTQPAAKKETNTMSTDTSTTTTDDTTSDDGDDSEDGTKLPRHLRFAVTMRGYAKRLTGDDEKKGFKPMRQWVKAAMAKPQSEDDARVLAQVDQCIETAIRACSEAADFFENLSDAVIRRGGGRPGSAEAELTEGATVRIVEKHVGKYDGIMSLKGLKVTSIRKGSVGLLDATGENGEERYFVPRAHVEIDA